MDGWTEPAPSPTAAKCVGPFPFGFADARTTQPGENPADLWRDGSPPSSVHPSKYPREIGWMDGTQTKLHNRQIRPSVPMP
jgi:hypothetical protein